MTNTVFSDPEQDQNRNADQDDAKDARDRVVDQHRELEIQRLFAVRVDLGRIAPFDQPDDERTEDVAEKMKEDAEQRAGVTENSPGADIADVVSM